MRILKTLAIFISVGVNAGLPVQSQTTPPLDPVLQAQQNLLAPLAEMLSHRLMGTINLAAHAAAAANICDRLELNERAIYGALASATHNETEGMTPVEVERQKEIALIAFGTVTAFMTTEAAGDVPGFCTRALADAESPEGAIFLVEKVPQDATSPAPQPEAAE